MKVVKAFFFFSIFFAASVLFSSRVEADSTCSVSAISNYLTEVVVNEDSTFDVSEKISYRANGNCSFIYRDITLQDYEALEMCKNNPLLQCGGFGYLNILGVYDQNGSQVYDYTLSKINNSYEDRLQIKWTYGSTDFNNEIFTWTIKYKVFGGLGYFEDYDLFYWDVFYPDRTYSIENAEFRITFPEDVEYQDENLNVITTSYGSAYNYTPEYFKSEKKLVISTRNIPSFDDFTVLLKFPKDIVPEYATLKLNLKPSSQDVYVDGVKIEGVTDAITGIIPGQRSLKFSAFGYDSETFDLNFKEGEEKNLEVDLKRSAWYQIVAIILVVLNVAFCIFGLFFIMWPILTYIRKGKDIGRTGVIYPQFNPPAGLSPVLVGSLIDERVNTTDITSTIINAAVRGFIKIKEISKKNYELIKLKDFVPTEPNPKARKIDYKSIDGIEFKILNDIFEGKNEVTTNSLKYKLYLKVDGINEATYVKMVENKYFLERPDHTRRNSAVKGVLLFILGIGISIASSFIFIFTLGPAVAVSGFIRIILSNFMPAKTKLGSEIYEKSQGFKMFLHTAERFKYKKMLTPETFERFLPYAMVFGVEKEWAKNFEDIYKEAPDWYEGRWDTFNTVLLANSLSNMVSSTSSSLSSSPSSSSGHSGGGWSGGGGFSGGFSGGGGGGGGGGMG